MRAGYAEGDSEAYEFTDVDRPGAVGLSLAGKRWARADDTVGLAVVVNAASSHRLAYLAAGGLGILVGDGQLPHPGPETTLETYYNLAEVKAAHLTFDYQFIDNPAYNRDRGPVSVFSLRARDAVLRRPPPYASSRMRFLRKLGLSTALRRRMALGVTSTSSSSAM